MPTDEVKTNVFELVNNIERFGSNEISMFICAGEPWFKGNDIAKILGYANLNNAVTMNVDSIDRQPLEQLLNVPFLRGGPQIQQK